MSSNTIPVLLVTANVGSIFEDPSQMLKIWTKEFLSTVAKLDPKFIALHCQEVGGKNYEDSMKHVKSFLELLRSSNELRLFDKIRVFLDEDYSSAENFTALGNLYFIHKSLENVLIWDFKDSQFIPVKDEEIYSGNIEAVVTKEKAKFPQNFFPECKWSRKGFLRTRWSLQGTTFDLINIHLFHDASNVVAMESSPSVYCENRRKALEHTLQRFHNDTYGKAPYFLFGDFNFRTDTEGVVAKLTEGLKKTEHNKNEWQYTNESCKCILTVGKKEFNHSEHQSVFLNPSPTWLQSYDKELESFTDHLIEYPVKFPPSYPFVEKITQGSSYMQTRCPAWCDRVLLSHTAKQIVDESQEINYNIMGTETCMGDHKPVYLKMDVRVNAGTVVCCNHAPFVCLPAVCTCCQSFAYVTINVVDMSDYITTTKKSYTDIPIDCRLLHEPITRDMLSHEPYTPESIDSHSPVPEKEEDERIGSTTTDSKRNSVSPTQLKSRLERIIKEELSKSPRMMKRSASENVDISCPDNFFRSRAMSEVPKTCRYRLISTDSNSLQRLNSHHSSSEEDWFKFDKDLISHTSKEKFDYSIDITKDSGDISLSQDECVINKKKDFKRNDKNRRKIECCSIA